MRSALARHDRILRDAVEAHGGYVFASTGDGLGAAFNGAADALAASVRSQGLLGAEEWPEEAVIRVRMGIHTGEAQLRDGNYFGLAVNQAARLMSVAHGGQILVSAATASEVGSAIKLRRLGTIRLSGLAEPEVVFQLGEETFPPLRSLDSPPGSLPAPPTELIGRERDVTALAERASVGRLLTLTGVGGVGKTRLAVASAAASAPMFVDGAWFVDLAPASSVEDVVRLVSAVLGTSATTMFALAQYLSQRRLLLVLDNCEQVVDGVCDVVEHLLAASPEVNIVVTSRQPLGLAGEAVRTVRPLALPDAGSGLDEARSSDGVRLFTERAMSASEGFALTDENVASVIEICRGLDGVPLALELAASRLRNMSVLELERRLSDRFSVLTVGHGNDARHGTLEGALAWSHDLLSAAERQVFRRLAVFASSFDLAAAQAIAGDGALQHVLSLADKSLITYDPGTGRYRLMETIRAYASRRLTDAGETASTQERHASYYVRQAAAWKVDTSGGAVNVPISLELENLRGAASWLAEQARVDELNTLCRSLFPVLHMLAPAEGARWYRRLLEVGEGLGAQDRIDLLGELGLLLVVLGDYSGEGSWLESIGLADTQRLLHSPSAWHAKTISLAVADDPEAGVKAAETTIAVADGRAEPYCGALMTGTLAGLLAVVGEQDRGTETADDALRRASLIANIDQHHHVITNAAMSWLVFRVEPDFSTAMRVLLDHTVDLEMLQPGTALWRAHALGLARLGLKDFQGAIADLVRALRLTDRTGHVAAMDQGARALAVAYLGANRAELAAQLIGYAEASLASSRPEIPIRAWLDRHAVRPAWLPRSVWDAGIAAGSKLDRRAFMRLINQYNN